MLMTDKIRAVAEWLGCFHEFNDESLIGGPYMRRTVGMNDWDYYVDWPDGFEDKEDPTPIICFSAYGESEAAKRGILLIPEGTTVDITIEAYDEYADQAGATSRVAGELHNANPKDPYSVATAKLDALYEISTSEGETK